jgi:Ca2+-binding RTX toxin-like protein
LAAPVSAQVSIQAVTASFNPRSGVLIVFGDALDNTVVISRDAAGKLLVNDGAVAIRGGQATVANTAFIQVLGREGNDHLSLNEANGALPRAQLYGGDGNDTLVGGSAADQLYGQAGNDALLGKGGIDELRGGDGNDALTGGDADDQAFGEAGDDRLIWNPGDDTDLNEGGDGNDTVEVNGGAAAETFTATANGTLVRFDRVTPAPFSLDMGTSENLVLNANGGDDKFSATGNLAALIKITVDGGAGNDTIGGSNGVDLLLGGDGNDAIDGQQGNDVAFLGAGDDLFNWDPGDGSDTIEGQDGADTLRFNGSGISELFEASANGQRVRFTRNIANIVMDLDDVESIAVNALGGADTITVNDLSGTDANSIAPNLAGATGGVGDGQIDAVIVNATNGDDAVAINGGSGSATVSGLAASISISAAEGARDTLLVNGLAGDDVLDAAKLAAGALTLTLDAGDGNDVLIGSAGADVMLGGAGDDVLLGGPGADTLDGGAGDNVVIQG